MSRVIMSSLETRFANMNVTSQLIRKSQVSPKFPCLQCVRYYRPRKPFWLPMGKTKIFRIPKKTEIPEEERIELSRLYNVYRTNMKSLRQYFKEQLMAQITGPEVIEEQKRRQAEQHAMCVKENDQWNAEVKRIREERLAREAIKRDDQILHKIMEHEKKTKMWLDQLDSHIRSEKENAKSFITPENIDEAVEVALANYVDHNFCIDKDENIYQGRYGKPSPKPSMIKSSIKQEEQSVPVEARN